ncbi:MAG: winged helix DNA-binding domain-containing protein [Gaiellaceae bacterium]
MVRTTWSAVRTRRLARQSLLVPAEDAVAVARTTCGIHAQVQAAAELSLSARVRGLTRQEVRDALWRDRSLVKAWTVRGTLHLHPAEELALWLAARRAVEHADSGGLVEWRDPAGDVHPAVTPAEVEDIRAAVWDALDDRCLGREELADAVAGHVARKHRGRMRSGFSFFVGDLCQGPPRGNRVTFARPDQWVKGWREVDERAALREAVRRFLFAYGPARPADFRAWFGHASFDDVDVDQVDVEGHRALVLARDTEFPSPSQSLRLLPEYDVYVMGFREREHLVPDDVRGLVAAHGRGRYEGPAGVRFLMIDGIARGLWERKARGKKVDVTVTPARTSTRAERAAIADEAARIGACLGLEPALSVG